MKLIFSPKYLAGLFLLLLPFISFAQNIDDGFIAAFVNEDSSDTIGVPVERNGKSVEIRCWFPKPQEIDTIIRYIKLVNKFEDEKGDNSEISKKERRDFLKKIERCRKYRYDFLFSVAEESYSTTIKGRTTLLGDAWTYQKLRELSDIVATRHPLVIQDYLITNCWPMHEHHSDGEYTPIMSQEECEKFVTKEGEGIKKKS